jgi:hypothetical protein
MIIRFIGPLLCGGLVVLVTTTGANSTGVFPSNGSVVLQPHDPNSLKVRKPKYTGTATHGHTTGKINPTQNSVVTKDAWKTHSSSKKTNAQNGKFSESWSEGPRKK